jgi:flagellar P-ring protein precursor FlgI
MRRASILPILAVLTVIAVPAAATTVGDIATFQGERINTIEGVGLVIGLAGTGDSSGAVNQALASLLTRQRISLTASEITARNVAVVWVQARIGPYLKKGTNVDITVSSMNDAKSLAGGQLVQTLLRGLDHEVYATAAGPVLVGGYSAAGQAAKVSLNHVQVGRIPGGGTIERELKWNVVSPQGDVGLLLREPDVRNAARVAEAVNEVFEGAAVATDSARIRVRIPKEWSGENRVTAFRARLVEIVVDPAVPSRIVLNERTGTIIAGGEISIGPVSISHGNLIISISETPEVSQPGPLAPGGTTQVVPRTTVETKETATPMVRIPKGTSVSDMAAALNAVGISPRDMVVVFQMLKRAGALHAELVVE